MVLELLIPDDPLAFIRNCVKLKKIRWTYHVNMRMKGRFISRQIILNSFENYEIIEEYPKDKYFPSYLIYSHYQDEIFHVLFAVDIKIILGSLLLTFQIQRSGKKILKRGGENYEVSRLRIKNAIRHH